MKLVNYWVIAVLFAGVECARAETPEVQAPFRLLTEHSPPGQFLDNDGKVVGVTATLIRILQQRLNEPGNIELMPWGRALSIASNTPNTALFETVRTAERENWFKWVGPLIHYRISLYGLKQRLGDDATAIDLPGKLIACSYRSTATAEDVKRFGFIEDKNLVLVTKSGECLDMLNYGRVDVMAITEYILPQYSKVVQDAGGELIEVRNLAERKRYLAFSKDVPDERINRWQRALEQSYRDGTMRELYTPVYSEQLISRLEQFAKAAAK